VISWGGWDWWVFVEARVCVVSAVCAWFLFLVFPRVFTTAAREAKFSREERVPELVLGQFELIGFPVIRFVVAQHG
jgi:hypothetical protein